MPVTTATKLDHNEFGGTLYLSMEVGDRSWKLSSATGLGSATRVKDVAAGNLKSLDQEITAAKKHFKLPKDAPVVCCYEAGRDGFWIHRALLARGLENHMVDSASIEVNRRKRRSKTDGKDGRNLLRQLIRFKSGEKEVWKVVQPPSVEQEDARHLHRELEALQSDRRALANRMESVLVTHGVKLKVNKRFLKRLEAVRQFDGLPLPAGVVRRLKREYERWQLLDRQLSELKTEVKQEAKKEAEREPAMQNLLSLRGIGPLGAWIMLREGLVWRQFKNRRQIAGFVGLVPTPYNSGSSEREQGISKAGNVRLRRLVVELAWGWLHFQPDSKLTKWYYERFTKAGGRARKVGLVALARKLLVALWRMAVDGEVPDGAMTVDWETKFKRTWKKESAAA
jgi:transposase